MKGRNSLLPGARRPTGTEYQWIRLLWLPEVERGVRTKGDVARYMGIFLVTVETVGIVRGDQSWAETVLITLLSALCFVVSVLQKQRYRNRKRLIQGLIQGDYYVTSAVTQQVFPCGTSGGKVKVSVRVRLSDGRALPGNYGMPSSCAEQLVRQKQQTVPVLMVQMDRYPQTVAVSRPVSGNDI